MHIASRARADRVAARNAVETAKARDIEARKDAALSPEAELAATVARQKEGI